MLSSKSRSLLWASIVIALILPICPSVFAEFPTFEYHQIAQIGNKMGQTSLVDVDKDGDLDWIAGCNGGDIWWFEYKSPDDWVRHTLGQKAPTDVGGTAFDIDGDGWIDQVSGGAWYRNTARPREQEFIKYVNGVILRCHDNVAADIDGNKKLDLVAMSDRSALYWYKIPSDPTKKWESHKIGDAVHGAIDPAGVADIDGDGDNDVVRTNVWFENADGKGTKWIPHKNINFGQPAARFPLTTKSWVIDLDKDGDNDIVQAEADCVSGRVAWHENKDGKGRKWITHLIADKSGQDFHSLAVADFDNDGDLDVFSGGGPLTKSPPHKWFIWENTDAKGRKWQQHVILSGKRCHEAKAADVDGDGDIDICSKPWNGNEHIYLQNMFIEHQTKGDRK
ncbi:MAG: VCBS repeat-containing protein [Planctomycetes bacterium]|nr:VCBS repeat-containing protein [Planctomycetota bacterium]